MREIAERRGLQVSWTTPLDLPASPSDPTVVAALVRAATEQGFAYRRTHSGAGHDTQNIAKIAKTAMVFARSKDGRSHTPEEFTSVDDAATAIRVLMGALHQLAY